MSSLILRRVVGVLAGLALLALVVLLPRGNDAERQAVVEPARTFQLSLAGPGQYRWLVLEGGGPTRERVFRFGQNDLVEMILAEDLRSGATVAEGQPLARLVSPQAARQVSALRAAVEGMRAQRAQLTAGMRPEEVNEAWRAVQRAEASHAWLQSEAERIRKLHAENAAGAGELESAELVARVGAAEVEVAKAAYKVARAPASPEVFAEIDARAAAIEAQLAALENLVGEETVSSPLAGVVEIGGAAAQGEPREWRATPAGLESVGETTILQVYDRTQMYVRVPLAQDQRARLAVGAAVTFRAPGLPVFSGRVESISTSADTLAGEVVFWVRAALDSADERLHPGMVGTARLELAGGGGLLEDNLLRALWEDVFSTAFFTAAGGVSVPEAAASAGVAPR